MRIFPKKVFLILLLAFIAVYGFWQARDYLSGPKIYLESPGEGASLKESVLKISGRAWDISRITLGGYPIYTDEAGYFEEEIVLAPGVNEILLEAEDKFGHKTSLRRMVFME